MTRWNGYRLLGGVRIVATTAVTILAIGGALLWGFACATALTDDEGVCVLTFGPVDPLEREAVICDGRFAVSGSIEGNAWSNLHVFLDVHHLFDARESSPEPYHKELVWFAVGDQSVFAASIGDEFGQCFREYDVGRGLHAQFPLWFAIVVLWIWPCAVLVRGPMRRWRRRRKGLCLRCGFDLTGNVSGTCPECGYAPHSGDCIEIP